ncbi:helix-hairpin-helix domain-containing protein [Kitasatospora sp. A2-31]|uniref:helix-hairpin-helix domain-containing protein n=1 Tax=Kitasatospora sp. A2-31 TaxID=2916414 RepID=UPI0027E38019|nr:helix-hairpin-helix domain-containing protein [Kitasatospora sp. A2-31]
MTRLNDQVQELLQEYADLISITGGDAFRARSYEKAARAVGGHPEDVARLDTKGLQQIPGVGKSTAEKIAEYLATGRMSALETLRAKVPPGVREMMAVPSVRPPERGGRVRRAQRREDPARHRADAAVRRPDPARRPTEDVINTWTWQRLKKFLRKDALR